MFAVCECGVEVTSFSSGSVVINYVLSIVVNSDVTELRLAIQQAISSSSILSSYTIDLDSIILIDDDAGKSVNTTATKFLYRLVIYDKLTFMTKLLILLWH